MGFIDSAKRIIRGENAIYNKLPAKLSAGISKSAETKSAIPAAKAIGMGAINPFFEWKERAGNFYGKPIG